jgi:hypothetical protein
VNVLLGATHSEPEQIICGALADYDEAVADASQRGLNLPQAAIRRSAEVTLEHVTVIRVDDDRSSAAREDGRDSADQPCFRCVRMHDVRPKGLDQVSKGHQCPDVGPRPHSGTQTRDRDQLAGMPGRGRAELLLPRAYCASRQDGTKSVRVEPARENRDVMRRPTDVQTRDHPQNDRALF